MNLPLIGVANSISANFQFMPLDTIQYAKQSNFEILQIYLNESLLNQANLYDEIIPHIHCFQALYFHAKGFLNEDFLGQNYYKKLLQFLEKFPQPRLILHFDEKANLTSLIRVVNRLKKYSCAIYLENYFSLKGKTAAEKNIKKFMALFTLANSQTNFLKPVLDIPRLFHKNVGFTISEALEWCFQLLNFFSLRKLPVLLHLIDSHGAEQTRNSFCSLGTGFIPYSKIFQFIQKTNPCISGIVLEFEDKINPLISRQFLEEIFHTA